MDVNPTAVVFLQSLIFLLQPPKQRWRDRLLPPPVAGCAAAEAPPPLLLPSLARPSLHSPTSPVIMRRRQPHTVAELVNPRAPLYMGIHYRVFPGSASSPSYAPPSSTAVVLSARRGQCGQRLTSIGRVLYVERLTAESTTAARKCLLITRKIIIPPPDSRDPPDGPPVFRQKNVSP